MYTALNSSRNAMQRVLIAPTLVIVALTASSCVAPFTEFQDARLAGPGRLETTAFYSATSASGEGDSQKIQDHYGVQIATGVSETVDLRLRYERVNPESQCDGFVCYSGKGVNVVGGGPKFGLVRDRLALSVPIGTAFGSGVESSQAWQAQPAILGSLIISPAVMVNAAAKAIVWLDRDTDDLLAFTLGAGLNLPSTPLWVRPEIGYLINPGEDGHALSVGMGVSVFAGHR